MHEDSFPQTNTGADIRLLGFPNFLSPMCHFDSAPRISMANHHLSQTIVLNKPEFSKLYTGAENNMLDYVFNTSKRDRDCEILAIIPKYRAPLVHKDDCPQTYVITLTYEPDGKRLLDYFEIKRYFQGNNGFGWIPEIENAHRIKKDEVLDKETVITHSPAVQGERYCLGTNLNTVYGSFPETVEDAFIVSETAAKKLETTQISQVVIDCRMDRRPLNINGDEYVDKFLPDIGSYVREDGALCAFRPNHWTTCIADNDPEALRQTLTSQDDILYIPPGSKILDLTFNINREKLSANNCYDQARLYEQNNTKCWEDIYTTYLKYKGKCDGLTPKMSTLVKTAIFRMIAQGARFPSLEHDFKKEMRKFDVEGVNGYPIEFMQVIVTYKVPRHIEPGSKLSDLHGAKGVVARVYPDHCMPVDEDGIRADLWIDMNSPVSRNNPGQLYECGINRISEFVRRRVVHARETDGVEAAFETLLDWYNDVHPRYAELVRENSPQPRDRKAVVEDAITNGPSLWIPPFLKSLIPTDDEFWNALINIKKWQEKWGARSSRIRYKMLQGDGSFKEFTTEEKFAIGSKMVIVLHKIPEIFAPGPAAVNHIQIPTKSNYETMYFPVKVNPLRFGEDELRVMVMDVDPHEVVRFQNLLSNSPLGIETVLRNQLLSEHPTGIKRHPISNGDLAKTSTVGKLFHATTAALGLETKRTRNDEYSRRVEEARRENDQQIADAIGATDLVPNEPILMDEADVVSRRSSTNRSKIQKMISSLISDEGEEAVADVEATSDDDE